MSARSLGERAIGGEYQIAVAHEANVRRIACDQRGRVAERRNRARVVEACREKIEQRRLGLGGHAGLVFERVGDATDEIGAADRGAKLAGQQPDTQRERARHRRKNLAAEIIRLLSRDSGPLHSHPGWRFFRRRSASRLHYYASLSEDSRRGGSRRASALTTLMMIDWACRVSRHVSNR